jgi:hypothetical protein
VNWSDPKGHVSLRYIGNEVIHDGVGNDGNPIIAVNKYAAEDLQIYEGYKLTSLSFYRNVRTDMTIPTQPVFKWYVSQGAERLFEAPVTNPREGWNKIELTTPLSIDVNKPLYYGVELVSHHTSDWPLGVGVIYSPDFVHQQDTAVTYAYGRANLFSENGGANWNSLDQANVPYALFYIQATLDKDPGTAPQDRLLGYKVFRNGINLLEQEFPAGSISLLNNYTDRDPLPGSNCYTIYADYNSLKLSEGANACLTISGIQLVTDESGMKVYPNRVGKNETITIELSDNWNNTTFTLYDLSGKRMKTFRATGQKTPVQLNVSSGIYLLKINDKETVKIVVK